MDANANKYIFIIYVIIKLMLSWLLNGAISNDLWFFLIHRLTSTGINGHSHNINIIDINCCGSLMDEAMKPKVVPLAILTIFCFLGLLYQVFEVTKSYLEHKIRRVIIRDFPFELDPPAVSLCFELAHVIPVHNFGVYQDNDPNYWTKFYDFMKITSAKDLFNLAPSIKNVFKKNFGCAIRFPSMYTMTFLSNKNCYRHFNIERYIQRQFMCYKFTPKTFDKHKIGNWSPERDRPPNGLKTKAWVMEYLMAPVDVGVIYSLYLNPDAFSRVSRVVAFAHGPDTDHWEDSFTVLYHAMVITATKGSVISVNYQTLKFSRLAAPYPSNCYHLGDGLSVTHLFADKLNNDTIKHLNKSCAIKMLVEGTSDTNYTIISEQDYRNESFLREFHRVLKLEERLSDAASCNVKIFASRVTTQIIEVADDKKIPVYMTWPQSHDLDMKDEPLQTILDLLIYVGSSLGFWFGFNVLTVGSNVINHRSRLTSKSDSEINCSSLNLVVDMSQQLNQQQKQIELLLRCDKINKQNIQGLMAQVRRK